MNDFGFFQLLAALICGVIFAIFAVIAFNNAREEFKEGSSLQATGWAAFGIMWSIPLIVALYYGWFVVLVGLIGAIIYIATKK